MLTLWLACSAPPEDTALPSCEEAPRAVQVVQVGTATPLENGVVQAAPSGGFAVDAETLVSGLLTHDDDGLHTLFWEIDVESDGSTSGSQGEQQVACVASQARLSTPIGAPAPDAEELTFTLRVNDQNRTAVSLQRTVLLTWP